MRNSAISIKHPFRPITLRRHQIDAGSAFDHTSTHRATFTVVA